MRRRIAANRVVIDDKVILQCVVELEDGIVTDYYPFTAELPYTEWIGGTIRLVRCGGVLKVEKL